MSFVLVILLMLSVPLNWGVTQFLIRAWRRSPQIGALRERTAAAIAISTAITVYVFAAINASMGFTLWDMNTTQVIARISFLVVGWVPALYWAIQYRRGF